MFAFKTSIPNLRKKIREEIALIQGGFAPDLERSVIEPTTKRVRDLTPRSDGGGSVRGSHLQDGWKSKTYGGGGKARAPVMFVIWNDLTHKRTGDHKRSALLQNADGEQKDYTLLEIIEYGSPAHEIRPVKARALRFNAGGEVVFTKQVDHPGTRPYAPVRLARLWATKAIAKFADRWARKIARKWD